MFLNLIASTWEDQLLTIKTRVRRISQKAVSHLCKCFYSLHYAYEANTTRRCYHEGQWGEEEADDQFDVWLVAHHLAHALTEGNELGSFPRGLCRPTRRIRDDSEIRGVDLFCCDSDFFPEEIQYLCKNAIWNMQTIHFEVGHAFQGWLGTKRPMILDTCSDFNICIRLYKELCKWVQASFLASSLEMCLKASDGGLKRTPISCHSSIPFCSFTPRNNTAVHRT